MFKIGPDDIMTGVKIHYVSTKEIADEVKADLEFRYGSMYLSEEDGNDCSWDPGGMLMTGDAEFTFPLDNITIVCKAQHFEYFAAYLDDYSPRGDKVQYVKIHGRYFCICITPEEFESLKALVDDPELFKMAEESWKKREEKLNKLAEAGSIKRVVKGEDGKLYEKVQVPVETDPKKLN